MYSRDAKQSNDIHANLWSAFYKLFLYRIHLREWYETIIIL